MTMQTSATFDDTLKALANPVRRQILTWLKNPEQNFPGQDHDYLFGVCAGKIDERCNLSQSTVSAHLTVLQNVGLITGKRSGNWVFYKRNEAAIAACLEHLEQSL
jgi:DNA-binding transcriptional ArsR family regulator